MGVEPSLDLRADQIRRGLRILQLCNYAHATGILEPTDLVKVAMVKFGVSEFTARRLVKEVQVRLEKEAQQ